MITHPVLDWLASSEMGYLASRTRWVFAAAQSIHFMGLSILFGAMTVLDLRILGMQRQFPIDRLFSLIPLAVFGFAIQLVTGVVMFSADPGRYWSNPGFRIKMILVLAAGLNALWFWLGEDARLAKLGAGQSAPWSARIVAALSLLIWLSVIAFGRFLPYLDGLNIPWISGA